MNLFCIKWFTKNEFTKNSNNIKLKRGIDRNINLYSQYI